MKTYKIFTSGVLAFYIMVEPFSISFGESAGFEFQNEATKLHQIGQYYV